MAIFQRTDTVVDVVFCCCYFHYSCAMRRCFLKFDKLIVDDNAYIYNDMEGRVEKLPHKVMIIRIILLIVMISLINWLRGSETERF